MSIDGIAALLFIALLVVLLWIKRRQVQLQKVLFPVLYVIMYRSSFGIPSMDWLAGRFPRLVRFFGDVSIILGFLGMLLMCARLIYNTVDVIVSEAIPDVHPVLPLEVKGVFFVPFLYWILSIFLLALVHEFAHGVVARANNMRVKSSGFAFLCLFVPVIPAAFVEPDESVVQKRPYRQQLGVFAAGSISNMVFSLVLLGVLFVFSSVASASFAENGVEVVSAAGPSLAAGLEKGDAILSLNNVSVSSTENITRVLSSLSPGDMVNVRLSNRSLSFALGAHPKNASLPYLGIQARTNFAPRDDFIAVYGAWLPPVIKWFYGFVFWLIMLNVGIGLFNLLPIGPLDGGRMFKLVCLKFFRNKLTALKVFTYVSGFFILIILVNLFFGFFY